MMMNEFCCGSKQSLWLAVSKNIFVDFCFSYGCCTIRVFLGRFQWVGLGWKENVRMALGVGYMSYGAHHRCGFYVFMLGEDVCTIGNTSEGGGDSTGF